MRDRPLDSYDWGYSFHFFLRRDFDRALTEALKITEGYPGAADNWLARCYEQVGHYPEALQAIRRERDLFYGRDGVAIEGHIHASMGRQSEARERLEELSSMARFRYVPPVYPAILNGALGDHDAAFAWLEKAYEDRSGCMAYSQSYGLAVDPYWNPLRGDPRYTDLLRRVGLLDRLQPLGATATPVEER